MKKFLALFLITLVLLGICSCNSNTNKKSINISDLEAEFDFKFNINEESSKHSFEHLDEGVYDNTIKYTGTANSSNEMISLKIVHNGDTYGDEMTKLARNKEEMKRVFNLFMTGQIGETRYFDLLAINAYYDLINIYTVISDEDPDLDEVLLVLCSEKTVEINGWNISVDISDTEIIINVE